MRDKRKITCIRFTDEEIIKIDANARAAGLSRSDFLRKLGTRTRIIPKTDTKAIHQLNRFGRFLNISSLRHRDIVNEYITLSRKIRDKDFHSTILQNYEEFQNRYWRVYDNVAALIDAMKNEIVGK